MSEAPKKIWLADLGYKYEVWFDSVGSDLCTPYIREDVVLELVEALEGMLDWFGYPEDHECSRSDKARAALKKLEESYD